LRLGSQFRPTAINGEWKSGNAVEVLGPSTKRATSVGCGRLSRSPMYPIKNGLSYHRLKRIFAASNCRSAVGPAKTIAGNSRKWVSFVPDIRRPHERPQRAAAATATDSLLKVERLVAKIFEVGRAA